MQEEAPQIDETLNKENNDKMALVLGRFLQKLKLHKKNIIQLQRVARKYPFAKFAVNREIAARISRGRVNKDNANQNNQDSGIAGTSEV